MMVYEWAKLCSQRLHFAISLGELYRRRGWELGEPYHTGAEWVIPASREWGFKP